MTFSAVTASIITRASGNTARCFARPSAFSARRQRHEFGPSWIPAPTSLNSGACSSTSDGYPRAASASAAASPPIPPPTMMIGQSSSLKVFIGRSTVAVSSAGWQRRRPGGISTCRIQLTALRQVRSYARQNRVNFHRSGEMPANIFSPLINEDIGRGRRVFHSATNYIRTIGPKSITVENSINAGLNTVGLLGGVSGAITLAGTVVAGTAAAGTLAVAFAGPQAAVVAAVIGLAVLAKGAYSNREAAHKKLSDYVWN